MDEKDFFTDKQRIHVIFDQTSKVLRELFPTTLVNGKEYPICAKCGCVTDFGPLGSRECHYCNEKELAEIQNQP